MEAFKLEFGKHAGATLGQGEGIREGRVPSLLHEEGYQTWQLQYERRDTLQFSSLWQAMKR